MTPEQTLDWLAQQHFDQCREERPIQDWIRKMKSQLPEQQEPVAIYQYQMGDGSWIDQEKHSYDYNKRYAPNATVRIVYTTPPYVPTERQRTWVGLTDEEVITMSRYDLEYAALIGEVQRKLKEKNT